MLYRRDSDNVLKPGEIGFFFKVINNKKGVTRNTTRNIYTFLYWYAFLFTNIFFH